MKAKVIVCLVLLSIAILPSAVYAQKYEINPYAGGFWPSNNSLMGKFRSDGIYGVRGGVMAGTNFEIGGNIGYINHFQPNNDNNITINNSLLGITQNPTRAWLYDLNFDYNFSTSKVLPYVSVGVGGLTTKVKDGGSQIYAGGTTVSNNGEDVTLRPTFVLDSGDTFFTFNYGGGVKALELWGPMGLFGDIRGRTIPNFFGHGTSWPELTGGLTFSWGER